MGGETRVEVQHEIFEPSYAARTFQRQDFLGRVNVTHATYMLHQTYVCVHELYYCIGSTGSRILALTPIRFLHHSLFSAQCL
jgi:hypothetical protein